MSDAEFERNMNPSGSGVEVQTPAPLADAEVSPTSKTDAPAALTFPASDPSAETLVTGVRIDTDILQQARSGPVAIRSLLACGIQSAFEASRRSALAIDAGERAASSPELKALLAKERQLGADQLGRLQRALNELGEARLDEVPDQTGLLEALQAQVQDPGVRDVALALSLMNDRLRAAAVAEVLLLLAPHVMLTELQSWLSSSRTELLASSSSLAEFVRGGAEDVSGDAIPRSIAVAIFSP
jgi:hypothetical protein